MTAGKPFSQILTFRPFPMKPHEFFIGKGRFCLYLWVQVHCLSCRVLRAQGYCLHRFTTFQVGLLHAQSCRTCLLPCKQ